MITFYKVIYFLAALIITICYLGFGSGLISTVFAVQFTIGRFALLHILLWIIVRGFKY